MPQQLLYLFHWHSLVDGSGRHRSSELMRMDPLHLCLLSEVSESYLHATDFQADMRRIQCHQQRLIMIGAHRQVLLQMNLCLRIEIDLSFLVALSENDALPVVKIDILPIQAYQLADSDSS